MKKRHICSFSELVALASIFACLDTQHFLESWLGAETSPLVSQALGCWIIVVIQGAWNTSQILSRLTLFVTSWQWILTCIAMGLAIVLDGLVWTEPFFLVFLTSRRGTKACALWFGRLWGSLHNRWSPTWLGAKELSIEYFFDFFHSLSTYLTGMRNSIQPNWPDWQNRPYCSETTCWWWSSSRSPLHPLDRCTPGPGRYTSWFSDD